MAFIKSKKVYAILMGSDAGKDIVQEAPELSDEELEKRIDEFFGKSGQSRPDKGEEKEKPEMFSKDDTKEEHIAKREKALKEEDKDNAYLTPDEYKKVVDYAKKSGKSTDDVVEDIYNKTGNLRKGVEEQVNNLGKQEPKTETSQEPIDYENITYPKGTSKEYTKQVNDAYEKALPVLEKLGIKESDFETSSNEYGGMDSNTNELMDKYIFDPYKRETSIQPDEELYEKKYQPLFDAIMAVHDKLYNDWWIKNK